MNKTKKYPLYYAEPLDKDGRTNRVIYEKIAQKESPAGRTTVLGISYGLPDYHKVWKISRHFYYDHLKKKEKELRLEFKIFIEYEERKAREIRRRK